MVDQHAMSDAAGAASRAGSLTVRRNGGQCLQQQQQQQQQCILTRAQHLAAAICSCAVHTMPVSTGSRCIPAFAVIVARPTRCSLLLSWYLTNFVQYPEIIFRPGNSHEESPDLSSPVHFSNCARPVVLYLNHLFMFGDFWVRTMPTLLNALRSPNGAWDTDYTIVVATGGQRLQVRWMER
jgi:hypothetical protein